MQKKITSPILIAHKKTPYASTDGAFAIVLDHTHLTLNASCKNSETLAWMRKYMDDNPFGCQSISGICGTSFIATFFNEKELLAKANELFEATDKYVTSERAK